MTAYLKNLFFRNSASVFPGEISLDADMSFVKDMSFRVDARWMQVEWGDGRKSDFSETSYQFTHHYYHPGNYHIRIRGENITVLDIPQCHLLQLNLSACPTLEYIDCSYNQLNVLDVRSCKWLYELKCFNNCLTELKLGTYRKLFNIVCSFNRLNHIDVSGCPGLVELYCNSNNLETLDIRKCHKLVVLNVEKNNFTEYALLKLIEELRWKHKGMPGLFCTGFDNDYDKQKVRQGLLRRGWLEI